MSLLHERLLEGIRTVSTEFQSRIDLDIEVLPVERDLRQYFTEQIVYVDVESERIPAYANAGCAVMNAVLALGVHPRTDATELYKRLLSAHRVSKQHGDADLLGIDQNGLLWTTSSGLGQLTEIIKNPIDHSLDKPRELPITVTMAFDPGIIHQALMHEYKGVYIDPDLNHAITLVGAVQKGDQTVWLALFPDKRIVSVEREVGAGVLRLEDMKFPPVPVKVNPEVLIEKNIYPVYLIGHKENPWKIPPEPPREVTGVPIIIIE